MLVFVGVFALLKDAPAVWKTAESRPRELAMPPRGPRFARIGWLTVLVSVLYFALVKGYFQSPHGVYMAGQKPFSYDYYYEDLIPNKNGIVGLVISLVTNPLFVLKTLIADAKVVYALTMFLPMLFLPLFALRARVLLVYGILFAMLATRAPVFSVHFQYGATLLPFAFVALPFALQQIEAGSVVARLGLNRIRIRGTLICAMLVASALVSWKFGAIVENQSFRGGFGRITRVLNEREKATYEWVRAQSRTIPPRASVGTTGRTGPHVSNRARAYFYPEHQNVDYLFLDEAELNKNDTEKLKKSVEDGLFSEVSRHDRLAMYRRRGVK